MYDINIREVVTLVNEVMKPGTYEIKIDVNNLNSGVYFYGIKAGDFAQTKKMLMIK